MNRYHFRLIRPVIPLLLSLVLLIFTVSLISAEAIKNEVEPNDSPGTANLIYPKDQMEGAIDPVTDRDYFNTGGVNQSWGFISLLDTSASGESQDGVLTAYGSDGTTVLQMDSGSWISGSVIALQKFVNGSADHFLSVNEDGDDALIDDYNLRYYELAFAEQPEIEPNDTPQNGTISSRVMDGNLADESDVDCFRISLEIGDLALFALNADPDGDGSSTDFTLLLYDPSGTLLISANGGGIGDNEVIDNTTAAETGVYAYCVTSTGGVVSASDEYLVGLLLNEGLYSMSYSLDPVWLNPGPYTNTIPGALLEFELNFTNTDVLTIPGTMELRGTIDDACLTIVEAPGASSIQQERVEWERTDLYPGETWTETFTTRAVAPCYDNMHQGISLDYFVSGTGADVFFTIIEPALFLPMVLNSP